MKNLNEMNLNEIKEKFGVSITGNLLTRKTNKNISHAGITFTKSPTLDILNKEYKNDFEKAQDVTKNGLSVYNKLLNDLHKLNLSGFTIRHGVITAEFMQKYSNIYPVNIILSHIINTVTNSTKTCENSEEKAILAKMTEDDSVILVEANDLDVQIQIDYTNGDKKIKDLIDKYLTPFKLSESDSNHTYINIDTGRCYRRFYKGEYETCSEILLLYLFYKVLYKGGKMDLSEIPVIRNLGKVYEIYLPITSVISDGYNLKDIKNKPEEIGFTTLHLANKYYSLLDMINSDINTFLLFYLLGFPIFDDIEEFKNTVNKLITKDNIYIDLFIDFYNELKEEGKR